jgi:hypothetical protein
MGSMNDAKPARHHEEKPPKRHWHAAEPFFDLKLSHWVEIFLTLGLVFVGVCQLVVYAHQAGVMRGQLDEMKSQRLLTIAQLRANLRRERPIFHPIGDKGQWIGAGEVLSGWEINPGWTNTGSTDAINVLSWWKLTITSRSAPTPNVAINVDCPIPPKPYPKIAPSIVQPGGPLLEQAQILSISDARKASDPDPSEVITLAGHLEYNDIFPGTLPHHFGWCLIALPHDISSSNFSLPRAVEEGD